MSGTHYCGKCHGLLTHQDRRPRTLKMRLQHRDARLYICRDCGTRNLVKQPPVSEPADSASHQAAPARRKMEPASCPAERYREIQQRIVRNRRACVKLKAMIDSDQKLLQRMSADR